MLRAGNLRGSKYSQKSDQFPWHTPMSRIREYNFLEPGQDGAIYRLRP